MNNRDSNQFEYSGHLKFDLFEPTIGMDKFSFSQVLNSLPEYEKGSPETPGYGFKETDFMNFIDSDPQSDIYDYSNQDSIYRETAESVEALRFLREEFSERVVYNYSGEKMEAFVKDTSEVDVVWTRSNLLLARGSRKNVKNTIDSLQKIIGDKATIRNIKIDPEFLFWVFYKYVANESLPSNSIALFRLTNASLSGEESEFGSGNRVNESTDISRSLPVIASVLQGHKFEQLSGHFRVGDFSVEATIDTAGTVHTKAKKSLREIDDLKRMLLSIKFQIHLSNLYMSWVNMEDRQKYVHPEFYTDLKEIANQSGFNISVPLDNRIKELEKLRNSESQ